MGCDTYECDGQLIRFSEDDSIRCLCTFPHNDLAYGGKLAPAKVRSLAMLGAAVVMIHHGELNGPVFLPHSLPQWLVDELERLLPEDAPAEVERGRKKSQPNTC